MIEKIVFKLKSPPGHLPGVCPKVQYDNAFNANMFEVWSIDQAPSHIINEMTRYFDEFIKEFERMN